MSFDALLNKSCAIQKKTETQDAAGQKVASWATVTGFTAVKCRIDAWGGQEMVTPSMVYEKTTHVLFMRNPTSINLEIGTYRILLDSVNYNILLVKKMYGFTDLEHLEVLLEVVK